MALSIARMMLVSRLRGFDVDLTVAAGWGWVAVVGVLVRVPFLYRPRRVTGSSPMIAAAAMSFSSVSVIGNALRLRRARV